MRAPMRRGIQDLDDVGPPEGGLRGVGEHGAHPLARDRTLDEHDPPVVPRDEDAAVCDIGDLEVELIAILHPPMLPHPRAPTGLVRWRHARVPGLHLPRPSHAAAPGRDRAGDPRAAGRRGGGHRRGRSSGGSHASPDEHVLLLARRKAQDVAAAIAATTRFDGIVIGGDSMFELDGQILGKPHRPEVATARWHEMRGRTGVLHSGHSVFRLPRVSRPRSARRRRGIRHLRRRRLGCRDRGLRRHRRAPAGGRGIHRRQPRRRLHRAGRGRPSTVVGMSLSTLRHLCGELGIRWTDLWTAPDAS
jgi:septum formation protein